MARTKLDSLTSSPSNDLKLPGTVFSLHLTPYNESMLHKRTILFSLFCLGMLLTTQKTLAQNPDTLKVAIEQFVEELSEDYEKKHLNLRAREIGSLENEAFLWKDYFMLKSQEEYENALGYTKERKVYFNFYAYESELDRQYALKYWLEDFIEGETVRPGRPVRSYPYATPTLIIINSQSIIICNYECKDHSDDHYDFWKKLLWTTFAEDESRLIEIQCDGPLEWTKNAPDPKNRGLF